MSELIVPDEIKEILSRPSIKLTLFNIDQYLEKANLQTITSPNIFEPNSKRFHPKGLFSEEIFGSITSMDRFTTEAVINLNTTIIHPLIFSTNIQKKALYTSIMSGKQYAKFDDQDFSFKLADFNTPGAGTGYQFFMSHLKQLSNSDYSHALRSNNLHKLLVKYKDCLTTSKLICLPAGLRDLDLKSSRLSKDDINKLYLAVLNLAASLSSYGLSEDTIFDGIRYQMQLKVAEIYDYLMDIISGKGGFLQKHYGARKISYSTRNVVSVAINDADTPEAPESIKADETMVPMLNLIKCFQPFFTNYVQKKLYGELFVHGATEKVPATNPGSLTLEYITLKPSEINRYTTVDGVNRIINQFGHVGFRNSPVSIRDDKGKSYWLLLTYSDHVHGRVFLSKTKDDLKRLVERYDVSFDVANIRPLMWVEALYLAGTQISYGKHALITRYPVLEDGSIYPCRIHVITTNPSKRMTVVFDSGLTLDVPHYPIIGKPYFESLILHSSRLKGLGADFDGDTVSLTAIWTKEGNEEIADNLNNVAGVIGPDMKLKLHADQDTVKLAIHNLSRQDITT